MPHTLHAQGTLLPPVASFRPYLFAITGIHTQKLPNADSIHWVHHDLRSFSKTGRNNGLYIYQQHGICYRYNGSPAMYTLGFDA